MPSPFGTPKLILGLLACLSACGASTARAQEPAAPPAYLAVVEGTATLERDGEVQPAVRDMPFVAGDRLRTENGRVEIDFPDGTTLEVGSYSEVEALSDTRVRLIAGTMDHLPRRPVAAASAEYLPQDLQRYGPTFDQYGSWNYDATYGYVWYPSVTAGWRPYYYGAWSSVPSHGWTWIGLDAWSWPTHHYGRWGYARNAWFWIPGRTWSGAWVSWGLAANYVSWCPLGFDGRPVFALAAGRPDRAWRGWTVMSREHFGYRGHYAHRDAIDPRRFDAQTPFVQTTRLPRAFDKKAGSVGVSAPKAAGVAVPRGTSAGTVNGVPVPETREPRAEKLEPRTANPYMRAVPRAPRAIEPGVPPVAPPAMAPAGKAVMPPESKAVMPPMAPPAPTKTAAPAPIAVAPLGPPKVERAAPPTPVAPPIPVAAPMPIAPPAPTAPPRAAGAPDGKPAASPPAKTAESAPAPKAAASAPAKRPR